MGRHGFLHDWNRTNPSKEFKEFLTSLYIQQDNKCGICKEEYTIENLVLDHCHKSGTRRGLLCRSCNITLGHFECGRFGDRGRFYHKRMLEYQEYWKLKLL